MQHPLPLPIDQSILQAQAKLLPPPSQSEYVNEFPQLGLGYDLVYNQDTERYDRFLLTADGGHYKPGCVLVKSKTHGNFFGTRLGWEHFPLRPTADGKLSAAIPHHAFWATAVFMP